LGAGALPVVVGAILFFKPATIWQAFDKALHFHTALSYQGLNLNWIWQWLVHRQQGLSGGAWFDVVPPPALAWSMKFVFGAAYGFLLVIQFRRGRDFGDFLWLATIGYLSYCTLNIGVHENHLFLAMILAFALLCTRAALALPLVVFVSLAANLNLLLFYGVNGRWQCPPDALLPVSVVLSLLNTALTLHCLWQAGQRLRVSDSAQTAVEAS
jgi:hypothetical protein